MMTDTDITHTRYNAMTFQGQLRFNEPMSRHTSWRVGGKAKRFYQPKDAEDLAVFLSQLIDDEEVIWIGLGSNLLVRDGGIDGTVICTSGVLNGIESLGDNIVRAEAGVACAKVARYCARMGLTGAEFMVGIPGTMGGALSMNAGAFGGETWTLVKAVETINRRGQRFLRKPAEFEIEYRQVKGVAGEWFIATHLELSPGNYDQSNTRIKELLEKRNVTQPTRLPSGGSTFRNPPEDHAGRLIEASGLKGFCIGGACVSDKHANFIINTGNATAADIESLIAHIIETVEKTQGVRLQPEVHIVGVRESRHFDSLQDKRFAAVGDTHPTHSGAGKYQAVIQDAGDFGKVAVLMGGWSAEREISLKSGNAVVAALKQRGVNAVAIDVGDDVLQRLEQGNFDRAFIALHGRGGEDGVIQGVLDVMGIPYTGSGVLGSALSMDKLRSKQLWQGAGLPTPAFVIIDQQSDFTEVVKEIGLPLAVKPVYEGSSLGITKVTRAEELPAALKTAQQLDDTVLAEKWIVGSEYTAAIVVGVALPLIRIETPREFYDYEAKYIANDTRFLCPCGLDKAREQALQLLAQQAFEALGCEGWGRVDFLCDSHNDPWLIEVNTVPGMTDHSLVPQSAKAAGIEFDALVWRILEISVSSQRQTSRI